VRATGIVLTSEPLPASVNYDASINPSNCSLTGERRITCQFDDLEAGNTGPATLKLKLNDAGTFRLTATVVANEFDDSPINNTTSETTDVFGPLQLTLTDSPDPVRAEQDLTYEIKVTNPNATANTNVQVVNNLPDNVTYSSVSTALCGEASRIVTCNFPQIAPNATVTVQIVVRPVQPGSITNIGAVAIQGGAVVATAPPVTTTVRPANDDFANRQLLTGTSGVEIQGSNVNATGEELSITGPSEMEPVDPLQVTKSVWYEWRPTYSSGNFGYATFSTAGSSFDTVLTVYARLLTGSLKILTRNDDNPAAGDRTSRVSFTGRSGVKYFIAVDGYHGAEGETALSWTQGPELQVATGTPIVESLTPNQVAAGTVDQLIAVRGTGFTVQSVVLVNGEERVTAPPFLDGNSQVLVAQLRGEDTAFANGGVPISVRTGDKLSPVDAKSTLAIGEFAMTTILAGETGTTQTRSLLDVGKPRPYTEWITNCDPASSGGNCITSLAVYRNASLMFCDREGVCLPTLRQYQIAHGQYCDDFACSDSLEDYRRNHNGQYPTDPAMPGAVVAQSVSTIQVTGVIDLSVVKLHTPAPLPDFAMLVGQDGAGLVGQDAAGLIALGLIGNDGAGVVSNDGAGVVSNDGAGFVGGVSGEGEQPPATQPGDWIILHDNNGNPATFTNTLNADGTTTGTASLELDDASLAMLEGGMIFAIVIPDKLDFSTDAYTIAENGGEAMITVSRSGTSVGRVTVMYATEDDTATADSDYTATSGMLTFETGEMTKTFSIPINNDTTTEVAEKIKLTLSAPGGIVRLGTQTTAELSITAPAFPWQNPRNRVDVNNDTSVSPVDVLQVVNEINLRAGNGTGSLLPAPPAGGVTKFYDVNGDGFVSPLDPLIVVNFLNSEGQPEAESRASSTASTPASSSLSPPTAAPIVVANAPAESPASARSVSHRRDVKSLATPSPAHGSSLQTRVEPKAISISGQRDARLDANVDDLFANIEEWLECEAGELRGGLA
ncbi:MAG: Calx-beta domain-containing protein, partial [Planctomycetota bacterium]